MRVFEWNAARLNHTRDPQFCDAKSAMDGGQFLVTLERISKNAHLKVVILEPHPTRRPWGVYVEWDSERVRMSNNIFGGLNANEYRLSTTKGSGRGR